MSLINSKDIVADRVRDIQAQAAAAGRARQVRGARQPRGARPLHGAGHAGGARRGLAAWAGVLARSLRTIETMEEL